MEAGRLSVGEFAFPGPLRDQLVAAILDGTKTTTTGLVEDYEREGEPLPRPGDREVVIDSAGDPVTLIEIIAVRVVRVGDVDLAHAIGEGEGYATRRRVARRARGVLALRRDARGTSATPRSR